MYTDCTKQPGSIGRAFEILALVLLTAAPAPLLAQAPAAAQSYTAAASPADNDRMAAVTGRRGFMERQLRFSRVESARAEKQAAVREMFRRRGLPSPATDIFLRIFKRERVVELWARNPATERYIRITQYPVCALSGDLGPKRREGDLQMPEGFYRIDAFNPRSRFHLSLRIDYPNRADRLLGDPEKPGGNIFIHGGCSTIGCVAIRDEYIKELYWVAVEARSAGQKTIPIHIYPSRLDEKSMRDLSRIAGTDDELWQFWMDLKKGFDYFERHRRVPEMTADNQGRYHLRRGEALAATSD